MRPTNRRKDSFAALAMTEKSRVSLRYKSACGVFGRTFAAEGPATELAGQPSDEAIQV